MRARLSTLLFCLICPGAHAVAQAAAIAFVDVNVVPMDAERILRGQTVIVQGDEITAIGRVDDVEVPAGARVIGSEGEAYLVPGLADMHTHVDGVQHLPLYIANGVTTMLHMGQAPAELVATVNEAIDEGRVVGPRLFFALLVDGPGSHAGLTVATPAAAREAVRSAAAEGYAFIKVYNGVDARVFAAIVDEAEAVGLAVIGHGVRDLGLPDALFAGQVMVAHAEEFFYTAFENRADRERIDDVARETLDSGAYVTPNLSTFEVIAAQWGRPEVVDAYLADARAGRMTPFLRSFWAGRDYVTREGDITPMLGFLRELTRAFAEAGVPLLTGTDSPVIPGMFPGYSLHDDLDALVRAGLSRYDALAAATRMPSQFIETFVAQARPFGRVEPGMKADLLLVRSNPLEELETLRSPLGVMSAGRWRDAGELEALVAELEAAHQPEP